MCYDLSAHQISRKYQDQSYQSVGQACQGGRSIYAIKFRKIRQNGNIMGKDSLQLSVNPSFYQLAVQTLKKCIERKRQFTTQ
jgi:hypothetical protein